MLKVLIIAIAIVVGVLALTLFAISKGYSYDHKVDPMPKKHKENDEE
ncbi:YtzI protein [Aquisalibacillus elongatus]|uniref:Tumor necrosis factor receptor superfamily member 19 n=1 Tax=Aquisalibacillus elongatus TaxID=485577 RepID=A0A3N5BCX8_9BACI|nr:YtzI protein [Aquisalibacillus elongatus]RPF53180.1 tumor necrosis factor receptor superfamily member 19 [Aquisalibacillus elongatus]